MKPKPDIENSPQELTTLEANFPFPDWEELKVNPDLQTHNPACSPPKSAHKDLNLPPQTMNHNYFPQNMQIIYVVSFMENIKSNQIKAFLAKNLLVPEIKI